MPKDLHMGKESHFSAPINNEEVEFHLAHKDKGMETENGKDYYVVFPVSQTSDEGDASRFRLKEGGKAFIKDSVGDLPMVSFQKKVKDVSKADVKESKGRFNADITRTDRGH